MSQASLPVVALGADHGGQELKVALMRHLKAGGVRVLDMGTRTTEACDYPVFGLRVAEAVASGRATLGVLVCRSGNGMAMAANKVIGVRAAIADTPDLARLAREHNDANVIVLGADYIRGSAEAVLDAFLKARPEGGRHARRVDLIRGFEENVHSDVATRRLVAAGQSPWLDDLSDMLIASGELKRQIDQDGIRGVTSNPAIFEKAINSGQGRYPAQLATLRADGVSPEQAYERITTEDIAAAADILRPVYDASGGDDGFVSYEVLPGYAYEEEKTVSEAIRLFKLIGRPNVMIKIPGTAEGIRAFRRVTAEGVNVNVTLIFSRVFYNDIARAYIAGLKDRVAKGGDVSGIRSVASVFVSRIDAAADKILVERKKSETDPGRIAAIDAALHGVAVANTKLIYEDFKSIFYGPGFLDLAELGAAPQRPLWASTGVKDPTLRDTLYVETLIAPQTVNTMPLSTMKAMLDHGRVRYNSIAEHMDAARALIAGLPALGIDMEELCMGLQKNGVKLFSDAFDQLFASIRKALGQAA